MSQITIQKTLVVHKEQLEYEINELQQLLNYMHTLINKIKEEAIIHCEKINRKISL